MCIFVYVVYTVASNCVTYVPVCLYVLLRKIPRITDMSLGKGIEHSWISYQVSRTPDNCLGSIRSLGWTLPDDSLTSRSI